VKQVPRGYTKCPRCGKLIPIPWLRGNYVCIEDGHIYLHAEKKSLEEIVRRGRIISVKRLNDIE